MKIVFNGTEWTLVDSLGRPCGWTRNEQTAAKVAESVKGYALWNDMPHKLKMSLSMSGFNPPR